LNCSGKIPGWGCEESCLLQDNISSIVKNNNIGFIGIRIKRVNGLRLRCKLFFISIELRGLINKIDKQQFLRLLG
jgi:hypothetical protein